MYRRAPRSRRVSQVGGGIQSNNEVAYAAALTLFRCCAHLWIIKLEHK